MPRNVCCVPGCPVVAEDGIPLHYFPNPEKEAVRFQNWIKSIGGGLDSNIVYKTQRICRRHFQDVFLYPKNRLSKLAIPSLHLPSEDVSDCQGSTTHEATLLHSNVILDAKSANTVENEPCSLAPSINLFFSSSQPSTSQRDTVLHPISAKTVKNKPCCSVTLMQRKHENQVKKMKLKLRRCLKEKETYRKKYLQAKRKSKCFEILTKNMSRAAKMLFNMQVKEGGKKPRGRRFTLDEKILALSLYKPSPKAYRLLSQLCVLPSRRTLQNILQKEDLVPGINENFSNI